MASSSSRLFLHEEVMLLALRDQEGTIATGTWHRFALAAAIISELTLAKRVIITDDKRQYLQATSDAPLSDPVIDHCLDLLLQAKRQASVQRWLQRFGNVKQLTQRIAARLCERGVLRTDEKRILLLFRRTIYPELNPVPERRLLQRLEQAIFQPEARMTARTALLIAIADPTGLLRANLDRKRLRASKKRIKAITEGQAVGKAAAKAVAAAQAAVAAAVIAASTAATS